jgi:hypothetical protein
MLETRLGALTLRIPSCARDRIFRAFSSRAGRRKKRWYRSSRKPVIQEAWIGGISTRRVTS